MKITANQVTLVRIFLLPIPSALVLWNEPLGYLLALLIGTVLGATDAVDGYMARRDGPTVLGALLDPMADKLFFAAFMLPLCAAGHSPAWVVGGVFGRELLITALRTSMATRDTQLKTSQLGKLKTVVQMGGLAAFYFTAFLPDPWWRWVNLAGGGGFTVAFFVMLARKRKWPPFWVTGTAPIWSAVAAYGFFNPREPTVFAIFAIMLVLTWVSGIDYIIGAWRVLMKSGFKSADVSRIVWSLAHATVIGVVMWIDIRAVVPLLLSLAGELALGGIDNVVSATPGMKRGVQVSFAISSALAVAASGVALLYPDRHDLILGATSLLAAASLVQAGRAFLQDREVFA